MSYKRISSDEAKKMIKEKGVTLVDIRDANSYSAGHLEDAVNINEDKMDSFLKETDKEKTLLVYCYKGFSSRDAAAYFAKEGFKEVYSVDGGYEELGSS